MVGSTRADLQQRSRAGVPLRFDNFISFCDLTVGHLLLVHAPPLPNTGALNSLSRPSAMKKEN